MKHDPLAKCRTLLLTDAACVRAASVLLRDAGYHCLALPDARRLLVSYSLSQHTLADALALLAHAQLATAANAVQQWHCKLLCFSETVQRANLTIPALDSKRWHAYSQVYQHQPHGDHDDTPEELRHER